MKSFQFTPTPLMPLMFALFFLLKSQSVYAACDNDKGLGEVFYNFDRITVAYGKFPDITDQSASDYPELLKFDNFNKKLLEAIKKNFSSCLTNSAGEEKPINIIPAATVRSETDLAKIHDPRNLTIFIDLQYVPPRRTKAMGIEEFGYIFFFIYRPGITYKSAYVPNLSIKNSGVFVFFPRLGMDGQLDIVFKAIRPLVQGTSSPPAIDIR